MNLPRLAAGIVLLATGVAGQARGNSELAGTVRDAAGAPIRSVLVTVSSLDRALQTRSDWRGRFRLDDIPDGKYELEFSAYSFITQNRLVDLPGGANEGLTVVLGITSMPDVRYCGPHPTIAYTSLQRGEPHVTGIIRDYYENKAVGGATVSLWRSGEKRPVLTSRTDRAGRFEFDEVPAGHFDLRISQQDHADADLTQILIPRETAVSLEETMLRRGEIVACQ